MRKVFDNTKKWIVHLAYYMRWIFGKRKTLPDFYAESIISVAARWGGEIDPILTYTAMYDVLRQRGFSGSFWELGGGYSTILAPMCLRLPASSIHSVDFNPIKYDRILNRRSTSRTFLSSINLYSEITVSLTQVEFALSEVSRRLCMHPLDNVKGALSIYAGSVFEDCTEIEQVAKEVVKTFNEHPHFREERFFYSKFEAVQGEKLCSHLVKNKVQMDALFLDCGELSSVAEFVMMEPLVPVGGYILLHDIFYPKSIKNYLVASVIELSSEWEILYRDTISSQGGLVAVRKHA